MGWLDKGMIVEIGNHEQLMERSCMVLYPFISEQYDFGHSDVTEVHDIHCLRRLFVKL